MQPRSRGCGCLPLAGIAVVFLAILAIYLFAPLRTNILLLGIDFDEMGGNVSRTDTMILSTVVPLKPYIGMLSIPRDLWVNIPGVGENRINTAHFFAEASQPGSGPRATMQAVRENFGVNVHYYARVRFDSFMDLVIAMDGISVDLPEPMANLPAGKQVIGPRGALAFVRQRAGSDDFFRMEHGQFLLKAAARNLLSPAKWPRIPAVLAVIFRSVDTNLPVWQWPRLGMALLRAGPDGIDSRAIDRGMVTGYITAEGADVLLPDWDVINPVLKDMFGQ